MTVATRSVVLVGGAAVLATLATGCVHAPPPKVARLRVIAEPETTRVTVDDQYAGRARVLARQPFVLTPGDKLITFEADDYFPHDVQVDLPQGETTIRIKLRPIPP